jgi:hypothetical protein
MNQAKDIKPYLVEKLKQEHCFWSYDNNSISDIPWYYFHAKRPRSYVKAMATRQLNKRLARG